MSTNASKCQEICAICLAVALVIVLLAFGALAALYSNLLQQHELLTSLMTQKTAESCLTMNKATGYMNNSLDKMVKKSTPEVIVEDSRKIDCLFDLKSNLSNLDECQARGCLFEHPDQCYFNPLKVGYRVVEFVGADESEWELILRLELIPNQSIISEPVISAVFKLKSWNKHHVQFTIENADRKRYQVPIALQSAAIEPNSTFAKSDFDFSYQTNPFMFKLKRKSNGVSVLDTTIGGLIFSDRFLQFATLLPGNPLFGIGESNSTLKVKQPFYMAQEPDGGFHGVFLLNSNFKEFSLLPDPALVVRTHGNGIFDFHVFSGPTPSHVMQQYTSLIGRPFLAPFWSLGYQISLSGGFSNISTLKRFVHRSVANRIPFDIVHLGFDFTIKGRTFSLNKARFPALRRYIIKHLISLGIHAQITLRTFVTRNASNYEAWNILNGNQSFVQWHNGTNVMGRWYPLGPIAYPDFFLDRTFQAWTYLVKKSATYIRFDSIEIEDAEPRNDLCCSTHLNENCERIRFSDNIYSYSDVQSLYGWSAAFPTLRALRQSQLGQRGFVISRSTFASIGTYAAHFVTRGDSLENSVKEILRNSFLGISQLGLEIDCSRVSTQLDKINCIRSIEIGSFLPMVRLIFNDLTFVDFIDQFPSVRTLLLLRYTLLPYLYTSFYFAHVKGEPVIRPLFYEFPNDANAQSIDKQFMLGSSILVSPRFQDAANSFYFPRATWLDWMTGHFIDLCMSGERYKSVLNSTSILQKGGTIVTRQNAWRSSPVNTKFGRNNFIYLSVVLDCDFSACGHLFWDDGDSIDTLEYGEYFLVNYSASISRNGNLYFSSRVIETDQSQLLNQAKLSKISFSGITQRVSDVSVECDGDNVKNCPNLICEAVDEILMIVTCEFQPEINVAQNLSVLLKFHQ